jgi:hypothetical protein
MPSSSLAIDSLLHHYTDAAAILNIVSKRVLWSTVFSHLNDKTEGSLVTTRAKNIIDDTTYRADLAAEYSQRQIEVASATLRSGRVPSIVSFSKHRDSLPMYRMYCPSAGGYAIGFSPGFLATVGHLAEVKYSEESINAAATDYLDRVLPMVSAAQIPEHLSIDNASAHFHNSSSDNSDLVTNRVKQDLSHKPSAFSIELESRLIHFDGDLQFRTSHARNFVIPYRQVALPNVETDVLLSFGPNTHPDLARATLAQFIEAARLSETKWRFLQPGEPDQPYRTL